MLIENVYPAAKLQRTIDECKQSIKDINEVSLHTLRLLPVHGRSVDVAIANEQIAFSIKQMLVLGFEAKAQQAQKDLEKLL